MNIYGNELIKALENDIARLKEIGKSRWERINRGETDEDDCFMSMRAEETGISEASMKIDIIKNGGTEWFPEYSTLDGKLVNARWCDTRYGSRLRVVMPNGNVVWTSAQTDKGLARIGIKKVLCKRPAWVCCKSSASGLLGAYMARPCVFPSNMNYCTGEPASKEPIEIVECA